MNNQNQLIEPIQYDGKLSEQYKIFVLNVFLGLITLGIYHYWGKTRQRRYTTSSFMLKQDRFEYTGYGGQLFFGMLKALIIILIISIPFFWAIYNMSTLTEKYPKEISTQTTEHKSQEKKNTETEGFFSKLEKADEKEAQQVEIDLDKLSPQELASYFVSLFITVAYLIFYYAFLPFLAVYGSLRFRVTHTRWRGIRGHMNGSSILYGLVGLLHLLLIMMTLGIWIPMADALKYKYKMNHISFGNQQAQFRPDYGELFASHFITFFAGFFGGLALGLAGGFITHIIAEPHVGTEEASFMAGFIGMFIFILIFYCARFWYKAVFARERYNALTFGNIGFNCKISGWGLLTLSLGNGLILIFTLGLGYPIILQRRMKFFCKYTTITGDLDHSPILQAVGEKDTQGEGVSSILDINIGLF